jgi:hypothetical protein
VKTLEEIVKIMKEDQDHIWVRLGNTECLTEKRVNSVTNINSKVIPSNDWKTVSNRKRSTNSVLVQQQEFRIPTVINRYAVLENLHEENQALQHQHRNQFVNVKKTKTRMEQPPKSNKVPIIGDSHARGCAGNLLREHSKTFEVTGNVRPGAGLQNITQAVKNEIRLNRKDCVIIWGGSNDINTNEPSIGLKHIMNFILQNQHTNIIIILALHRHDLDKSSCINNEIQAFNRKLSKMTKAMSHVVMFDVIS